MATNFYSKIMCLLAAVYSQFSPVNWDEKHLLVRNGKIQLLYSDICCQIFLATGLFVSFSNAEPNHCLYSYQRDAYSCFDYGSEFEQDSEVERKKVARKDLAEKTAPVTAVKPSKNTFVEERSRDEARYMRHHFVSTNAVSFLAAMARCLKIC